MISVTVVFLVLISSFSALIYGSPASIQKLASKNPLNNITSIDKITLVKMSYNLKIGDSKFIKSFNGIINVMVTFKLKNEPYLLSLLKNISTPGIPQIHNKIKV